MNIYRLREALLESEGKRLKPYACPAGKLTIGVGRNLDGVGISDDEAELMLKNDIARAAADLDRRWPAWRSLDDVRQNVVADMVFNLGISAFLKFKVTIAYIEAKDYKAAAAEMLKSKWAQQVGNRAIKLSRMMESGRWPDEK